MKRFGEKVVVKKHSETDLIRDSDNHICDKPSLNRPKLPSNILSTVLVKI